MQVTPVIAVHMTAALAALVVGPLALWARQGRATRPMLHRAAGYAWVTLMVLTALSAVFIRNHQSFNIGGFTWIHLFIPTLLVALFFAFYKLARRDIAAHRQIMQKTYIGACVIAGVFTLMPGRYLGHLVWSSVGLI